MLFQIENLIDKKNLRIKVTRDELEELCNDLFDKVALPAQRALEASKLTMDLIKQVYLHFIFCQIYFFYLIH